MKQPTTQENNQERPPALAGARGSAMRHLQIIKCGNCGGSGYMGGTVYHRRFFKCKVCGGSGDIVVDMSCGDCDPCIGGRPDQCALLPSPNVKLTDGSAKNQ
jgi:hypothetical protein